MSAGPHKVSAFTGIDFFKQKHTVLKQTLVSNYVRSISALLARCHDNSELYYRNQAQHNVTRIYLSFSPPLNLTNTE